MLKNVSKKNRNWNKQSLSWNRDQNMRERKELRWDVQWQIERFRPYCPNLDFLGMLALPKNWGYLFSKKKRNWGYFAEMFRVELETMKPNQPRKVDLESWIFLLKYWELKLRQWIWTNLESWTFFCWNVQSWTWDNETKPT